MKPIPNEDSFRKALGIIKEDEDNQKYPDDFEPVLKEIKLMKINQKILDVHLNPRSAEPHLHKSKALNLKPLNEMKTPQQQESMKIKEIISQSRGLQALQKYEQA